MSSDRGEIIASFTEETSFLEPIADDVWNYDI